MSAADMGRADHLTTWQTLKRGFGLSPELRHGAGVTLALALFSTLGRILVPIAVQQAMDRGVLAAGGPRTDIVVWIAALSAAGVILTGLAAYVVNLRLFRSSEGGLATLRIKGFRHIHDLSMLTQNAQRRGSLVSRVTSDVDQISQFVQFSGLMLVIAIGQLFVATVVMLVYSPILALVVWLCFVPLFLMLRKFQAMVGQAYMVVRERVGDMLAAIAESVVGAVTIRAYAVEDRTSARIDEAVRRHQRSANNAQVRAVGAFCIGQFVAGFTTVVVLAVGTVLAVHGRLSVGELVAFLFIVTLFTQPIQTDTENLNDLQNAAAGWRRVIALIDTPADIVDPGNDGTVLPRGPISVDFDEVTFAYPGGPPVLHDINLHIGPKSRIAVVGETGSGKSTLAKLLTRLVDPTSGVVRLDQLDVREVAFTSLRSRVVLVPQEGFLFDATIEQNAAFGKPGATTDEVALAFTELGLDGWLAGLPHGLATEVGQRGESLSAGERQLVALARAYLADPDLLLLDEATSAVDPATEVRIARALESLTAGRTSIAIAHRLSTAEAADEVIVMDAGRIVQRGPHRELVTQQGSRYAALHQSWAAQARN